MFAGYILKRNTPISPPSMQVRILRDIVHFSSYSIVESILCALGNTII